MSQLEEDAAYLSENQILSYNFANISSERKLALDKIVFDFNLLQQSADSEIYKYDIILMLANVMAGKDKMNDVALENTNIKEYFFSNDYIGRTLKSMGATYDRASEKDLLKYAEYFASEEAQWIYSELFKGLKLGFEACLAEAAKELEKVD